MRSICQPLGLKMKEIKDMYKKKNIWLLMVLLMLFSVGCTKTQTTNNVDNQTTIETEQDSNSVETETDESQKDEIGDADTSDSQEDERGDADTSDSQEDEVADADTSDSQEDDIADVGTDDIQESDVEEKEPATLNPDTVVYAEEEVCTVRNVNIRTEPSTESEVLRVASRREKFVRTANDGEWSAVVVEGKEYYISSEYLMLASEVKDNGYLVVIDAGHQGKGNHDKEPIGPGASETKAKVASGTTGVSTGIPEYQMTLAVSQMLRDELEARGYQVMMIRESHDVNISNAERAQVANSAGADVFIRVHVNGSEDRSQNGILTICQTPANPYNGNLYQSCRKLSECVLDSMISVTGANRKSIWETDTMSGINWCQVPVTIVEMGFMSNPAEDELMATDSYRYKLAIGMADGIDAYFGMN